MAIPVGLWASHSMLHMKVAQPYHDIILASDVPSHDGSYSSQLAIAGQLAGDRLSFLHNVFSTLKCMYNMVNVRPHTLYTHILKGDSIDHPFGTQGVT